VERVTTNGLNRTRRASAYPGRFGGIGAGLEAPSLLLYTSGTTASPKGVQHTAAGLLAEVLSTAEHIGRRSRPLYLFPAGHIGGVTGLLRPRIDRSSALYLGAWNPGLAAVLVAQERLTWSAGAPIHLALLLDDNLQGRDFRLHLGRGPLEVL